MVFIDLEKAYDRVSRQEVSRCVRKKGVPEKYVRIVKETMCKGKNEGQEQHRAHKHDHRGSSLSPYLFDLLMDVPGRGIKEQPSWCMLFADDIVLCSTIREEVERKLEEWRTAI